MQRRRADNTRIIKFVVIGSASLSTTICYAIADEQKSHQAEVEWTEFADKNKAQCYPNPT